MQTARKPNFVLDDQSSRPCLTAWLEQPTRRFRLPLLGLFAWSHRADARSQPEEGLCDSLPIWSCSVWGLPCRDCYQPRGGLLPRRFTLTAQRFRAEFGGLFSVALAVQPACTDRPGRYPAHCPAEFGLSSPSRQQAAGGSDHPAACTRLSVAVGARPEAADFSGRMGWQRLNSKKRGAL